MSNYRRLDDSAMVEFWFYSEEKLENLTEKTQRFNEWQEYFTAHEMAQAEKEDAFTGFYHGIFDEKACYLL